MYIYKIIIIIKKKKINKNGNNILCKINISFNEIYFLIK